MLFCINYYFITETISRGTGKLVANGAMYFGVVNVSPDAVEEVTSNVLDTVTNMISYADRKGYIPKETGHYHTRMVFEITGSSFFKEKNTYILTFCHAGIHETESSHFFTRGFFH